MRIARVKPSGLQAQPQVPGPLLAFERVHSRRREPTHETLVLADVSFELAPAATLGVYGERRSGKSTLLRLAAGLELADAGTVRIAGADPARLKPDERTRLLRGPVALLAPDAWAPGPVETVTDHVATALGSAGLSLRAARRAALTVLDRVGVAGVAEELALALAPAERARVELARALVREPRLLLLDEPAPFPSLRERERCCALLREIAAERALALLVASEELGALAGLQALTTFSGGALSFAHERGAVLDFPRKSA